MKYLLISLCQCMVVFFMMSCGRQESSNVESPDKNISVDVWVSDDGKIMYTVRYSKAQVLDPSLLGVRMEDEDFTGGLVLESVSAPVPVNETYTMAHGKRKDCRYQANERTWHFTNASGGKIDVVFRVSNDGVAFRYVFPGTGDGIKKITEEITSFNFPDSARAWLQHKAEAQSGWANTNPSYEEYYQREIAVGTPSPTTAGWVFPALFRAGNCWMLLSETGMDGTYCAASLRQESPGGEYRIGFPQAPEAYPGGALYPQSVRPWQSPWRIIAVGGLGTLVESTLGTDLAAPAASHDTSFVRPGKASWSWALLKDDSIVYDVQKRFIDYAADMAWQYCLVDVNWDTKIGYDKIKELADYGKSKNVGLILWYNSSGDWNTTVYHPKSKLLTHDDRVKEFSRLQEMGIKGVKVDFFAGDGQSMIQYYIDIIKDAAAYGLLVNCHGSTLPRGLHRTYPNLMTMEAIKGFEFITFDQRNADVAPEHCAMLPFTRNAFDPMDFTPVCLYKIPGIERRTTSGFELALSVLYLSGIQHYAETPAGMRHVPAYVKEFLRTVPARWDDTRFIDGYPGKLNIIARQKDDTWFIAGINAEPEAKKVRLDLSFANGKQGYIINDGNDALSFIKNETAANGPVEIDMKPRGGFVMVLQ